MELFEYTTKGCADAIEYLKNIEMYDDVKNEDGFTIVATANYYITEDE